MRLISVIVLTGFLWAAPVLAGDSLSTPCLMQPAHLSMSLSDRGLMWLPGEDSRGRCDAAVGYDTSTTSGTIKKVAAQGRRFDICEHDKQVPIKLSLQSVSIRANFSSTDMLGGVAPEEFREYDVSANFRLPWAWYSQSGWGVGIRLMASAGALYGSGETALVVSLIPIVALGSQDGRFTLDMGAGGALLSRHRFGTQDYGGYFQFALTAGVGVPLFKRLGVGYRFLHYSDAGIHGPHNTGADFHMLELTYQF